MFYTELVRKLWELCCIIDINVFLQQLFIALGKRFKLLLANRAQWAAVLALEPQLIFQYFPLALSPPATLSLFCSSNMSRVSCRVYSSAVSSAWRVLLLISVELIPTCLQVSTLFLTFLSHVFPATSVSLQLTTVHFFTTLIKMKIALFTHLFSPLVLSPPRLQAP